MSSLCLCSWLVKVLDLLLQKFGVKDSVCQALGGLAAQQHVGVWEERRVAPEDAEGLTVTSKCWAQLEWLLM